MNPTTALWIILVMSLASAALVAPLSWEFRQEMANAKAAMNNWIAVGLVAALFGLAVVALWWYIAIQWHQPLLAVIPTAAYVWGRILNAGVQRTKAAEGKR